MKLKCQYAITDMDIRDAVTWQSILARNGISL